MRNIWRYVLPALAVGFLTACSAWAVPYYQLRDVSGERDGHTIAGSQWFATVREGRWIDNAWGIYRDTHGGEAPTVPMVTSADLISDFKGVYLEDPQHNASYGDDVSFDAVESVYLVLKEGRGDLKVLFGNDYAHHSPYGPQNAMEDLLLAIPGYTTRATPGRPQLVSGGSWLDTALSFQSESPQSYGSSMGYLTFRQSAEFDTGFTGYRESIKIPLVVANVHDGSASDSGNELIFDMAVVYSGDVVTRSKFRWGADRDLTRDIGTFFMIRPYGAAAPGYTLETRITNRTGTRYRAQRYDTLGSAGYGDLLPKHWLYDLTPDLYGSLPESFLLDAQSQIAPGLVTVYENALDMTHSSSESFRLYPYRGSEAASNLRLTYRRVGGMASYNSVSAAGTPPAWTATGFNMTFADIAANGTNTADEIAAFTGGKPVMPPTGYNFTGAEYKYVKADAFNSFTISADAPAGFPASDDIALLPVHIRMRISRSEALLAGIWDNLSNADSVVSTFANTCAVWIRSDYTAERDMNLFTTLRNRGSSVEKCAQAFTYGDYLYLDFIVLIADAVSQNTGKTAFCQVVEDDGVPYILIGDGNVDGKWNLTFYVAAAGSNPGTDPGETPNPGTDSSGGDGGGCTAFSPAVFAGIALLILLFILRAPAKYGISRD